VLVEGGVGWGGRGVRVCLVRGVRGRGRVRGLGSRVG
jgi:hypothetical protein